MAWPSTKRARAHILPGRRGVKGPTQIRGPQCPDQCIRTPTQLLVWLFVFAVLVRTAMSTYEVPSVALTPELTSDYDERTRIMAWRIAQSASDLQSAQRRYAVRLTQGTSASGPSITRMISPMETRCGGLASR